MVTVWIQQFSLQLLINRADWALLHRYGNQSEKRKILNSTSPWHGNRRALLDYFCPYHKYRSFDENRLRDPWERFKVCSFLRWYVYDCLPCRSLRKLLVTGNMEYCTYASRFSVKLFLQFLCRIFYDSSSHSHPTTSVSFTCHFSTHTYCTQWNQCSTASSYHITRFIVKKIILFYS